MESITLYKVDTKGKVREWTMVIDGDSYYTITGEKGGKLITNKPVYCEPKNVGKANETSAESQAYSEASAKITKKRESGYYDNLEDAGKGKQYFAVQLAHHYKDHKKKVDFSAGNVYVQPKLDGIRSTQQYVDEFECNKATSREGKDQPVVVHILEAWGATLMEWGNAVADGELYNHLLKHDFNKITSAVKKQKSSKMSDKKIAEWHEALDVAREMIEYHVYDMFFPDNPEWTFSQRYQELTKIFDRFDFTDAIVQVPTYQVHSLEEIHEKYEEFLEEGYEGAIIRLDTPYVGKKTSNMLKYKPKYDDEFEILYFKEGTGNRVGMAGAVYIKVPGVDDPKKSNIKGPRSFLEQLWNEREDIEHKGLMGTIEYSNLTPAGVPRFPYLKAIRDYE